MLESLKSREVRLNRCNTYCLYFSISQCGPETVPFMPSLAIRILPLRSRFSQKFLCSSTSCCGLFIFT